MDDTAVPSIETPIVPTAGSIYSPPVTIVDGTHQVLTPIFLPDDETVLRDSIRSCIKHDEYSGDTTSRLLPSEMSLCFLGTSAGIPSRYRNTSATLLRLGGTSFLFDAGEGVQRQFQFVMGTQKLAKLQRIFITHLHADHIFGLPGLVLGLHDKARAQYMNGLFDNKRSEKKPHRSRTEHDNHNNNNNEDDNDDDNQDKISPFVIQIYGPPGLYHYIASSLLLSCTKLVYLKLQVYELVGGRVRRVASPLKQQQRIRDPFSDEYPEYSYAGQIERKRIQAQDGIWTIEDKPPPLTRDMIIDQRRGSRVATQRLDRLRIRAAEVDHLPGIVTFGYVVEEDDPPRNIDPEAAKAAGVSPQNRNYELLKHGFAVQPDMDGFEDNEEVHPHQVLKPSFKRARKVAIVGDNRNWTRQMTQIAQHADVLVHEATLTEENYNRGHSTAAMAGRQSAECNASVLVLNHISPKCESDLPGIVREAYEGSQKTSAVVASFDFMELLVPWMGFRNSYPHGEEPLMNINENATNDDRETDTSLRSWLNKLL
ncbi:ribonuclease Z [Nitzschia inconspicua]|uniref:Ribonuclease Z n=1 Tax=Nitzschia inconspicua TaxID=303405 RepID=A0A9K3KI62_9STRA|nr:ribonuclease Z [Nitzschia inconspicua]